MIEVPNAVLQVLRLGRSESAGTESCEQLQRKFHETTGLRFAKPRLPSMLAPGPLQTVGSHGQRRVERPLPATEQRRGAASRPGPDRSPGGPSPRQHGRFKGQGRTPRLSLGLRRYRPAKSPQCKADRIDRAGVFGESSHQISCRNEQTLPESSFLAAIVFRKLKTARDLPRWHNWRMSAGDIVDSLGGMRSTPQHPRETRTSGTVLADWSDEPDCPGKSDPP